jgi:hypothetical protein
MVDEFTNEITDGNAPLVNLSSVIFCPLLNLLVIKQYYYQRIYGRNRRVKKITRFILLVYPSKYTIGNYLKTF